MPAVLIYICFHFSVLIPESYLNDPIFITENLYLHSCINICPLCVDLVDCAALCLILLFTLLVLFGCYYASDLQSLCAHPFLWNRSNRQVQLELKCENTNAVRRAGIGCLLGRFLQTTAWEISPTYQLTLKKSQWFRQKERACTPFGLVDAALSLGQPCLEIASLEFFFWYT